MQALFGFVAGAPASGCRESPPPSKDTGKGNGAMVGAKNEQSVSRMPVLFVGHGSPMNAIQDNAWSRGFRALAALLPQPKAILCVSAHWFVQGTFLTGNDRPETIHDFGGFPKPLFDMQYPARGDVALAKRVALLLGEGRASLRTDWGLDHGTWTVLHHLRPDADVPVVQLSIDARMPPSGHLALGRELAPLRDEGVLVLGSGNVTHNLRLAMRSIQTGDNVTPAWAAEFDADVAKATEQHDGEFLARALSTDAGRMAHPSADHYLPLLYAAGAADPRDTVRFPVSGFDAGSLSMRSVLYG
jgi:4,5-DOPA dioxygenase extradiol